MAGAILLLILWTKRWKSGGTKMLRSTAIEEMEIFEWKYFKYGLRVSEGREMDSIYILQYVLSYLISEVNMLIWCPRYENSHGTNPILSLRIQTKVKKVTWLWPYFHCCSWLWYYWSSIRKPWERSKIKINHLEH